MSTIYLKRCINCKNRSENVYNGFAYCYVHDISMWMMSVACEHFCDMITGKSEDYF